MDPLMWVAVITAVVDVYTNPALMVKLMLLTPAGMVTEGCTLTAGEGEASVTTMPPAGAGPVKTTRLPVSVELLPIGVLSSVTPAMETGPTCTAAEADPAFADAVMVAGFRTEGMMVLNPNVPVVRPALITMDGLNN